MFIKDGNWKDLPFLRQEKSTLLAFPIERFLKKNKTKKINPPHKYSCNNKKSKKTEKGEYLAGGKRVS